MRSKWKGVYIHTILYRFIKSGKSEFNFSWLKHKINLRSSVLVNELKEKVFFIHDGLTLTRIKIFVCELNNVKLGQLSYNRKLPKHGLYNIFRIRANKLIAIQKGLIKSKKRRKAIWKKINLGVIE